jgi:ribosomal protein L32
MMNNYQDRSTSASDTGAGFQFEFSCQHCDRTWRSPFTSYKRGRLAGLISWLAISFSATSTGVYAATRGLSGAAQAGHAKAREKALAEAIAQARTNYTECGGCSKWLCNECYDSASGLCPACRSESASASHLDGARAGASGGQACPSCGQASGGGRFCEGCGYDMAATHKSCPGCGAMVSRQARFCTDCGHGF